MPNLFDKAKKATTTVAKADPKRETVEIVDKDFHRDLTDLAILEKQIAELVGRQTALHAEVKERAKEEFVKLYGKNKKNPGSFNIVAKGGKNQKDASFMFLPTDNYIKIKEEERANYLNETYSPNLVTINTEYKFNKAYLEKYGDVISTAIENSELPEDVKENLIEAETSWKIKKGTINEFVTDSDLKKFKLETLVEEIQPIFQVKGIKINE